MLKLKSFLDCSTSALSLSNEHGHSGILIVDRTFALVGGVFSTIEERIFGDGVAFPYVKIGCLEPSNRSQRILGIWNNRRAI